jgi:hypothetical protein
VTCGNDVEELAEAAVPGDKKRRRMRGFKCITQSKRFNAVLRV